MRRVKLTTEWVSWMRRGRLNEFRLAGIYDHVAAIVPIDHGFELKVYTRMVETKHGWVYLESQTVGFFPAVEEAVRACEDKLIEIGRIDIMWWVSHGTEEEES